MALAEHHYYSTGIRQNVDGELTLHGFTRQIPLAVKANGFGTDPNGGQRAGFSATAQINRGDFGISRRTVGGAVVGDKVQVSLKIETTTRLLTSTLRRSHMLAPTRSPRDQRSFLLQRTQPAMTGPIDGADRRPGDGARSMRHKGLRVRWLQPKVHILPADSARPPGLSLS